jgi:hypothetical protein
MKNMMVYPVISLLQLCASNRYWHVWAVALAVSANPALAFEFHNGDLSGSFDTTLSLGIAQRIQSRDASLIGIANDGTSRSVNEDNGDLNYDKNDLYAATIKATHELELKYQNFGAFFRATYFWDAVNHDKSELGNVGKERVGQDFEFLDAYVHGKFSIAHKTLNVRLGNQVVSWGESTFIPNGINIINPVNLSKLRTPGAELREALLPTTILWVSQELSNTLSVEGFYQTNWKKTRIDPRGTYFSSNDFLTDDGDRVYIGFGRRKDEHKALTSPLADPAAAVWAPRNPDRLPKDSGQYGLAARIFLPTLNNTEIGLFHINYHSRIPYASGIRGTVTSSLTGTPTGTARYFDEYPENIRLWGISFNTSAPGGIALQGEYSYRPNLPLQLSAPELLLAALGLPNVIGTFTPGQTVTGYRRVKAQQVQVSATKAFGPTFGADDLVVVGEVGYNHLDLPTNLRFNGPGVYLPSSQSSANLISFGAIQTDGFATKQSWGYRLLARMDFSNAIGAVTVSPRIAFSHDVDGTGPNFNEGVKAATLGLGFNFKQNWQADFAYTAFFGGRTYSGTDPIANTAGQPRTYASSANPLKDRDFIAASLTYSF